MELVLLSWRLMAPSEPNMTCAAAVSLCKSPVDIGTFVCSVPDSDFLFSCSTSRALLTRVSCCRLPNNSPTSTLSLVFEQRDELAPSRIVDLLSEDSLCQTFDVEIFQHYRAEAIDQICCDLVSPIQTLALDVFRKFLKQNDRLVSAMPNLSCDVQHASVRPRSSACPCS